MTHRGEADYGRLIAAIMLAWIKALQFSGTETISPSAGST